MSLPQSAPRLLCLHGHGSNESVTAAQLQNLGFDRYFEVTHLTAPWQCTGEVDESVRNVSPNGPFRSWTNPGNGVSHLITSLRFVLRHIVAQGPYDAVYGFSHGAGIAALLSCDTIRTKLDEKQTTDTPWEFIFAACASFPLPLKDIFDHFGIDELGLSVPCAHMIVQDPLKQKSDTFLVNFGDTGVLSLAVYFEGGHEISSDSKSLKKVANTIIDWFAKHCPHKLNSSVSEYSFLRAVTEEMNALTLHPPESSSIGGKIGQYHLNRNVKIDNNLSLAFLLKRPEIQNQIAFRSPGKKPITFGALWHFVRNEGNLSTVGCQQGDRVAYLVPFGVVGAAAFISIAMQCQAIPLDPESTRENLDDAFRQFSPDVFILFDDLGDGTCAQAVASAVKFGIRIVQATGRTDQRAPFVFLHRDNRNSSKDSFLENKGNENCLLLRTSGTTSQPKIVPLKMSSLVSNALAIANNLGLRKTDVGLNAMPLFHIGGLMTNLLASFVSGGSTIFLPKFDAFVFISALTSNREIRPTWFSAVPTMLAAVETLMTPEEAIQNSLRFIRVGAAAISEDLIKRSQLKFGCRVIPTYSMTECMPISQPPTGSVLVEERPGSVGQTLNVSVCVVDSNLVPLPRNNMNDTQSQMTGEICISGPTVMTGYISDTNANQNAFFRLGMMTWFRTGDLGYLDQDGFLYITGRGKEMIKINGEQVSPIEIEDACMKFPKFKACVAFSQPSEDSWGEQIGIACVLLDDSEFLGNHKSQLKTELRSFLKTEGLLANWKIPNRIEIVKESDLPKTRSGKYIRVGLSGVLDKIPPMDKPRGQVALEKITFHRAAIGAQFVLAVAVMYVHIGNLGEWAVPSSRNLETYTKVNDAGDWSNTRTWCLHTPLFFFVGGFLLATGVQAPISGRESLLNFYKIRILSLHPMYLVSILLCVFVFIPRCHPGNYISGFDPTRTPLEDDNFVCQATPAEMSWGWTLFTSILNYAFLLQSWFFTVPFSWFLSNYTWFSSSYMFCIFVFPWCHKPFFAAREDRTKLWKLTMLWVFALYFYVTVLSVMITAIEKEAMFNWLVLSLYMFPPGWVPCFSIGIGACFLLKHYLKTQTIRVSSRKWGLLTDLLSLVFLLGWIGYGLGNNSWARPYSAHDTKLGARYWAAFVSRLICPIGFLWYVGLCLGKGSTGWLLSGRIIVEWLAPSSYNVFLFHGPVSEIYFWVTRGVWWSFPKPFYWFSPYPVPVHDWEIPLVMAIVTIFSVLMHFWVNDKLIAASHRVLSLFQKRRKPSPQDTEKVITDIVKETVARISNIDPSSLHGETDLTEIGISSMALPVAISEINLALKPFEKYKQLSSSSLRGSTSVNDLISLASDNGSTRDSTRDSSIKDLFWSSRHSIGLDIEEGANISG